MNNKEKVEALLKDQGGYLTSGRQVQVARVVQDDFGTWVFLADHTVVSLADIHTSGTDATIARLSSACPEFRAGYESEKALIESGAV